MLIGLVGKPSSGKSTFFKACTLADVDIAEHPFTTIEPNKGVGYLKTKCPCQDFNVQCDAQNSYCMNGYRFVPVKLLDVAGLVPGAHKGKGLGNQFLDDLRRADGLIHVVDASGRTNELGERTTNYDYSKDVKFLNEEIIQWFKAVLVRNFSQVHEKFKNSGRTELINRLSEKLTGLKISKEELKHGLKNSGLKVENLPNWTGEDYYNLAQCLKQVSKPIVTACNKMDLVEEGGELKCGGVPCSALSELVLRKLSKKDFVEYVPGSSSFEVLEEDGLSNKELKGLKLIKSYLSRFQSTGVQEVLNTIGFDVLNLKVVYPVEDKSHLCNSEGEVLPDAMLLPPDATVLDLAYKIHSSIGDGFIKAVNCRTNMIIGKDAVLEDGDVVKIHSTA